MLTRTNRAILSCLNCLLEAISGFCPAQTCSCFRSRRSRHRTRDVGAMSDPSWASWTLPCSAHLLHVEDDEDRSSDPGPFRSTTASSPARARVIAVGRPCSGGRRGNLPSPPHDRRWTRSSALRGQTRSLRHEVRAGPETRPFRNRGGLSILPSQRRPPRFGAWCHHCPIAGHRFRLILVFRGARANEELEVAMSPYPLGSCRTSIDKRSILIDCSYSGHEEQIRELGWS
jgi:hypothetical protein